MHSVVLTRVHVHHPLRAYESSKRYVTFSGAKGSEKHSLKVSPTMARSLVLLFLPAAAAHGSQTVPTTRRGNTGYENDPVCALAEWSL